MVCGLCGRAPFWRCTRGITWVEHRPNPPCSWWRAHLAPRFVPAARFTCRRLDHMARQQPAPPETAVQRYIRAQHPRTHLCGESVRGDGLDFVDGLLDVIPSTANPFLKSANIESAPLSFRRFREFLERDEAGFLGCLTPGSRVGLCLPNGPALASMLVTTMGRACACPVRFESTSGEIEAELRSFRASAVVIKCGEDNSRVEAAAMALSIKVVTLEAFADAVGEFRLRPVEGASSVEDAPLPANTFNRKDDVALVLHTSGTSGKKKVVPYRLETLLAGAVCIAASWELRSADCCCGIMPLFHIGGIARTVLAILVSGSSTICCPAFDPAQVWSLIGSRAFTWYYAGPTMHQMLATEARNQPRQVQEAAGDGSVRMLANAAGGLLPSLAEELKTLFGDATIFPGYGMTECMPISSPPPGYTLSRPGSSGLCCGPSVAVLDPQTGNELPAGQTGTICVKGAPLFDGYEAENESDRRVGFNEAGYFDTGDAGYVDQDGFLFITGRNKEIINRGG
jgi:acyl-CoA synthetase (AMP-forming)/AMP-acid ligase II